MVPPYVFSRLSTLEFYSRELIVSKEAQQSQTEEQSSQQNKVSGLITTVLQVPLLITL